MKHDSERPKSKEVPPSQMTVLPQQDAETIIRRQDVKSMKNRNIVTSPSGKQPKSKTSRYFEDARQSSLKHDAICSGRSSSYFATSPSSTYGSLQALGPLIYTWTSNNLNASAATMFCHRPKSCSNVCSSCAAVINSSLVHFTPCPEFSKYIKEHDWIKPGETLSCVESTGKVIEKGVRHLCSNRCFLRAFAPSREWVFFRKALHELTDESLNHILSSWTCKLVDSGSSLEDHDQPNQSRKRSRVDLDRSNLPRTQFFSAIDQQCYSHIGEAMRALGLDKSIFEEDKVPRGSPPASPASSSGRRLQGAPTPVKSLPSNTGIESPLGLLEELFGENPWLLLMCTILLNRTRRIQVDVIFTGFLERWPTPEATLAADVEEICHWIMPLGIKGRRSRGILKFCKDYLELLKIEREKGTERPEYHLTRSEIMGLYHCGEYAADAYQIFIQRDWTNLYPKDHALRAYVEWKRCEGICMTPSTTNC